jgi:hypothetical protein
MSSQPVFSTGASGRVCHRLRGVFRRAALEQATPHENVGTALKLPELCSGLEDAKNFDGGPDRWAGWFVYTAGGEVHEVWQGFGHRWDDDLVCSCADGSSKGVFASPGCSTRAGK